jgi:hypothetical protein
MEKEDDGTAERSRKRRRLDDATTSITGATAGGHVGALSWVVVHDEKDPIIISPELALPDADKTLITRALLQLTQYKYEILYLISSTPGMARPISNKIKYNLQVSTPAATNGRGVNGPFVLVEVQFPIGIIIPVALFNNVSAIDPARIPMSEMKITSRLELGSSDKQEMIQSALFRVYSLPQTTERIYYVFQSYTSSHHPGATPVSEVTTSGNPLNWLMPFFSGVGGSSV